MILFTKIRWRNFLSTGNIFTEIVLNNKKNTLIIGENGSGKSTLLDALTFALFGKAFRNINKPQLINSINKKDALVELYFNIGSNKYKIIRGIKPTVFEVYMNDNLLNQSAESKDYQEILEKQILKVNYKSFCQVVVLGSATFQPFMQLSKGQRREVIEDLLDLQIFTSMNSLLKNKISVNADNINDCILKQNILEQKIVLIKDHLKQIQSDNTELIEEKNVLLKKITDEYETIEKNIVVLDDEINVLKTKVKTEKALKEKSRQLDQLRHKIEANLNVINNDILFFNNHEDCPTCKQSIEHSFKQKIVSEKDIQKGEIEDGLNKLSKEYEKLSKKIQTVSDINSKLNDLTFQQYTLNSKLTSLLEKKDQTYKDIEKLKIKTSTVNDDKISELEADLNNVNKVYTELSNEKNLYNAASILLKDNGIKSRIIKQYVPIMNKLINKYLSALDFFVHFELNEEFEEILKSRYRDEFSYSSFSEGEKMKINLAILFTWRAIAKLRNSINTNILIMDEVFDSSLDSNGIDEFLKMINDITSDTNVVIISHKTDQLYDKFDKVIQFKKVKNFSRIV